MNHQQKGPASQPAGDVKPNRFVVGVTRTPGAILGIRLLEMLRLSPDRQ